MMRSRQARAVVVRWAAVAGYVLATAALAWAARDSFAALRDGGPADLETLATAAAATGAWLCLGWLGVGFAVAVLSTLPGAAGRCGAQLSRRVTPKVVRRLAELALGVTVASGVGLTGMAPALADDTPRPSAQNATGVAGIVPAPGGDGIDVDGPVEPGQGGGPTDYPGTVDSGLPSLDRPAEEPLPPPAEAPVERRPAPQMSGYAPAAQTPSPPPRTQPTEAAAAVHLVTSAPRTGLAAAEPDEVVVRRGDSLWAIAARHLGDGAGAAEIAAAWPRWHAANRHLIGADPDLIRPGQRLRAPDTTGNHKEGR
jgi:nucleoid-associated protein YgaU